MSAQDMYPWSSRYSVRQYLSMCEDIDNLSAENKRLREANRGMSRHITSTGIRDGAMHEALDSMDERIVPTVLREFWHPAPEEVLIEIGDPLFNVDGTPWRLG